MAPYADHYKLKRLKTPHPIREPARFFAQRFNTYRPPSRRSLALALAWAEHQIDDKALNSKGLTPLALSPLTPCSMCCSRLAVGHAHACLCCAGCNMKCKQAQAFGKADAQASR